MIEQRVTLRYGAQQIPAIVQAVQGDTGRDVIFELADYEIPAGATANYYIDKPDGNAVYNSAEVISSTEILAHLTEQALAVPGRNNGQVRILSDDEVITSFDFVLEVEAFRGILRLQSETEINIFDQAIEDAVNTATEEALAEIQAQTPVVTGMQNSIAPAYSSSRKYVVGDYVMYNAQLYICTTAITTPEAWTAAHWTTVPLAPDITILKNATDDYHSVIPANAFDGYLFKDNCYLNDNFVLVENNGLKLYRFPLSFPNFVNIEFSGDSPIANIAGRLVVTFETKDGVFERTNVTKYASFNTTYNCFFAYAKEDTKYIYLLLNKDDYSVESINIGSLYTEDTEAYKKYRGIVPFNASANVASHFFLNDSDALAVLSADSVAVWSKVNEGDTVILHSMTSGFAWYGGFIASDGTRTKILSTALKFIAPSDGLLFLFDSVADPAFREFIPANIIKLNYENIEGTEPYDPHTYIQDNNLLSSYLYGENVYFNSGAIISLSGYNVYKIPVEQNDIVILYNVDGLTDNTFGDQYRVQIELSDGTYIKTATAYRLAGNTCYFVIAPENAVNVFASIKNTNLDNAELSINLHKTYLYGSQYVQKKDTVSNVIDIAASSQYYKNDSGVLVAISADSVIKIFDVKAGDKISSIGTLPSAFSFAGTFDNHNGSVTRISKNTVFTAPSDGTVYLFNLLENPIDWIYFPYNSIKVDYKDIVNPPTEINPFDGLNCVAFGTSLTYRSETTVGFITYLRELSGMTIDNQGIGSSTIKGNMLTAIRGYDDWADKKVCLLEGFVNDWYYNASDLGTWQDTTESTVCGCVRVALNYILSQNPDLTVFLILDHYGRDYNNVDSSSTALNAAGETQYEWWTEIGKIAESLGVPVIREYAISQISENTPQYLLDNIHLNTLGAEQSGYAIWSQMKQYYPNKEQ